MPAPTNACGHYPKWPLSLWSPVASPMLRRFPRLPVSPIRLGMPDPPGGRVRFVFPRYRERYPVFPSPVSQLATNGTKRLKLCNAQDNGERLRWQRDPWCDAPLWWEQSSLSPHSSWNVSESRRHRPANRENPVCQRAWVCCREVSALRVPDRVAKRRSWTDVIRPLWILQRVTVTREMHRPCQRNRLRLDWTRYWLPKGYTDAAGRSRAVRQGAVKPPSEHNCKSANELRACDIMPQWMRTGRAAQTHFPWLARA